HVGKHGIESDHRGAQDQHDPKEPTKLAHVIAMITVAVAGMPAVDFMASMVLAFLPMLTGRMLMVVVLVTLMGMFSVRDSSVAVVGLLCCRRSVVVTFVVVAFNHDRVRSE